MDNVPPNIASKTSVEDLKIFERDRRIYLSKLKGKNNIDIAAEEGMSACNVKRILRKMMERIDEEDRDTYRNIITDRLEGLYKDVQDSIKIKKYVPEKIRLILHIQNQLAKLLGLYQEKVDITSQGQKITIAGIDINKI